MNSNVSRQESPLSRLLEDDTLTIIETILPYCRPPLAKMLAVQMKLLEIRKIISDFEDEPYLRACGFEDASVDVETILRSLRNSVSEEKAGQIDSLLNFIRFSRMYQNWQETMQNHPELMQLISQSFSRNSNEKGTDSGNPLADPSLFFLLNSAMNGTNDTASGDTNNNEQMKMLLDYAMKNKNGNTNLGEMLSTFMKKQNNS